MLTEIFDKIEESLKSNKDISFNVKISFLEVYNENLIDLLNDDKLHMDVLEDPEKGTLISNLTEVLVKTKE